MKLILAICLSFALFFFCYGLLLLTLRKEDGAEYVKKRVRSLQDVKGQKSLLDTELQQSFFRRIISPLFEDIRQMLLKFTPHTLYEIAVKKTNAVGSSYKWGVEGFLVYWITVSGLIAFAMLFYFLTDAAPFAKRSAVALIGTLLGIYLPIFLINIHIKRRRTAILGQLPDMMDLLCISVQAGLSFDAALRRITDRMTGPLIEECALMLQEVRFGMTRRQSLERLADRCELQEVSLWTAAIIQADKLGVSLADTLVIQADNMRENRRQRVRKLAQQAPIKMLFPLAVFIFPAIFIVTLVPTFLAVIGSMQGLFGQ